MAQILDARGRLPHAEGFSVPLDRIDFIPGWNPRNMTSPETRAHVEDLKGQIKARGWDRDSAILGRWKDGRFLLKAGHCRTTACWELQKEGEDIEAIFGRLETRSDNDYTSLLIALRDPGQPLNKFETGGGLARMITFLGGKESEAVAKIAKDMNKPTQWVYDCLNIQGAPAPIYQAVRDGKLSVTEGLRVIREDGAEQAAVDIQEAAKAFPGQKITRKRIAAVQEARAPESEPKSVHVFVERMIAEWDAESDELDFDCLGWVQAKIEALRVRVGMARVLEDANV